MTIGACFAGAMIGVAAYVLWLPDVAGLKRRNPAETSLMRLRELELKKLRRKPVRIQLWIPFERISPHLKNAVIVAEDGRFWEHQGIDWDEFEAAMRRNWEKRRLFYGASTITQQLAKNLYLSPSKNPVRKAKEFMIAREMEERLGKRRILELYLNVAEWGQGIYGAQAASLHYFGKPASDLSPQEAATLAALLPSPARYSKARNARYVARMAQTILIRMRARGFLPPEELPASV